MQRRGAVLLIVLILLVMFLVVGMTFLLVANNYRQGAREMKRHEERAVPPQKIIDEALGQLLYGTTNVASPLRSSHLLGDLYGADYVEKAAVGNGAAYLSGGEFLQIPFTPNTTNLATKPSGYFNGGVLTMTSGRFRGYSARIVGFTPGVVTVERFDTDQLLGNVAPASGDAFIINHKALNGVGAGYQVSGQRYQPGTFRGFPLPLLPFVARVDAGAGLNYERSGTDEPYDAVDYQNMFLAQAPTRNSPNPVPTLPSFVRPRLINYLARNGLQFDDLPMVCARPLPIPGQHPGFSGSNPALTEAIAAALTSGNVEDWHTQLIARFGANYRDAWDVDNDADGVTDSVWVDIGLPAMTAKDGRRFKPLVAYLVKDLDGRANLNASGTLAEFNSMAFKGGPYPGLGATPPTPHRRGMGLGPAEVSLAPAFTSAPNYQTFLQERYAGTRNPGTNAATESVPGFPGATGALAQVKHWGWLSPFWNTTNPTRSAYGSPLDWTGQGYAALDHNGNLVYQYVGTNAGGNVGGDGIDDPYELLLLRPESDQAVSADSPYTVGELELLLRGFDHDVGTLPRRLANVGLRQDFADSVTTRSRSLPVAGNVAAGENLSRQGFAAALGNQSLIDQVVAHLNANGVTNVDEQLAIMLPLEVLKGGRMDLNRPFGNGRDDNNNGVVDEVLEYAAGQPMWSTVSVPNLAGAPFQGPLGGSSETEPIARLRARQIYARQLYCLMMFLTDSTVVHPAQVANSVNQAELREMTARRIAQWCINVVDFRDPDAIMTPFEFDLNPYNGWQVDMDINTDNEPDRALVWGCEPPDLLLTESLAFHNKRLKDTDQDASMKFRAKAAPNDNQEDDNDLDQFRVPEGSLFFEIYCPRQTPVFAGDGSSPDGNPRLPVELYGTSADPRVLDVGRLAPPDNNNDRYPVWRVSIYRNENLSARNFSTQQPDVVSFQPEDMHRLVTSTQPIDAAPDRVVWFAATPPGGHQYADRTYFRRDGAIGLYPGEYGVVGPRTLTDTGLDAGQVRSPQQISLNANSVQVTDAAGNTPGARSVRGFIVQANTDDGRVTGINVSEPRPANYSANYPPPVDSHHGDGITDKYTPPLDEPLDYRAGRPLADEGKRRTGTHLDHRTAFLQRLADPTLPHNPVSNPYLTVDWITVDLTVFNGDDRRPANFMLPQFDPTDPDPYSSAPEERFETRQIDTAGPNTPQDTMIYSQITRDPQDTNEAAGSTASFRHPLGHSFGILNPTIDSPLGQSAPYTQSPASRAFPHLVWHNRPFTNAFELLTVPSSSPQRLLMEFRNRDNAVDPYQNLHQPEFGHLLGFFNTSPAGNTAQATNYYRLLDYVEVPSPFADTERYYNAQYTTNIGGAFPAYRPPYNKLSRFSDPGKVNLNTLTDPRVWAMLDPTGQIPFTELQRSIRGFDNGSENSFPTLVANPFRPSGLGSAVPLASMQRRDIDTTLLRSSHGDQTEPLFADNNAQAHINSNRSSMFRYERLRRLRALTTCQSNVFAVWITVGYFEVAPANPYNPQVHYDGLMLGPEIGIDTGKVKRHRSFFVIDRSIPVGYELGQPHNADRCVLLRRRID